MRRRRCSPIRLTAKHLLLTAPVARPGKRGELRREDVGALLRVGAA
jgi:hypothetical protein